MRELWTVIVFVALALAPGLVAAHGGAEVAVTGRPYPGGPIEIKGTDFEEGEVVTLELRKQGQAQVLLGSIPVQPDGTFEVTLHVPAEVRPGLYELVASAGDESTSAEATILEPPDGSAAGPGTGAAEGIDNDRPAGETIGLAIVTVLMAVGGAAIILSGRRDRPRPLTS